MHGWGDSRSYFVGGFEDCDGQARDGLTSNAFWVLSGMLAETHALRQDILAALVRVILNHGGAGGRVFELNGHPWGSCTYDPAIGARVALIPYDRLDGTFENSIEVIGPAEIR